MLVLAPLRDFLCEVSRHEAPISARFSFCRDFSTFTRRTLSNSAREAFKLDCLSSIVSTHFYVCFHCTLHRWTLIDYDDCFVGWLKQSTKIEKKQILKTNKIYWGQSLVLFAEKIWINREISEMRSKVKFIDSYFLGEMRNLIDISVYYFRSVKFTLLGNHADSMKLIEDRGVE